MKLAALLIAALAIPAMSEARPLTRQMSLSEILAAEEFQCAVLYARGDVLADPILAEAGLPPLGEYVTDEQYDTLLAAEAQGYPAAVAALGWWDEAVERGCE